MDNYISLLEKIIKKDSITDIEYYSLSTYRVNHLDYLRSRENCSWCLLELGRYYLDSMIEFVDFDTVAYDYLSKSSVRGNLTARGLLAGLYLEQWFKYHDIDIAFQLYKESVGNNKYYFSLSKYSLSVINKLEELENEKIKNKELQRLSQFDIGSILYNDCKKYI